MQNQRMTFVNDLSVILFLAYCCFTIMHSHNEPINVNPPGGKRWAILGILEGWSLRARMS